MKKQTISFLAFAILASSVFFSCKETKQKQYGNMEFDSIQVNETAHILSDTASPSCSLTIDYVYPVKADNQALADSVNKALASACFGDAYRNLEAKTAVDSFKNTYVREYKSELQDLYLEDLKNNKGDESVGGWYSYYQNIKTTPLTDNPKYLVYQIDMNEFRGGAHGSYSTFFLNFNPKTGHIVELDNVFLPGYKKELSDLLVNKLMKQVNASSLQDLQDKAYLQDTEMYPSENFRLGKDGITFFYNVYEIAPYSSGTTELTLSYEELKGLMEETN